MKLQYLKSRENYFHYTKCIRNTCKWNSLTDRDNRVWFCHIQCKYNGAFQKRSILPPGRKFLPAGGGGEKKLFLIIVNVLGHSKGGGGLTSYFLRGGGMDVFWNDPIM
jgi:hypothetical protein